VEARDGGSSSSDAEAGGLVVVEGNATAARQEKRERREEEGVREPQPGRANRAPLSCNTHAIKKMGE